MRRLRSGGRIDRTTQLSFTFDGTCYTGHAGDTLASALLANGVTRVATSVRHGRPRGVMAAGVDEASALIQIEAPFPEPMLPATTVELYDGLVARGLPGRGCLAAEPDPARYDAVHVHCHVLVVGAGPAGLLAAQTAARAGLRVVLVDEQPELGGSLLGDELARWTAQVAAELAAAPEVRVLTRTTAFGYYDDGFVLALERRTDHLGHLDDSARQRVWRVRARQVIVATGSHERPIAFTDNDLPGVMLAGAARTYLHRYGVLAGDRVVLFSTNDSAYVAARDLEAAGAQVSVVDARGGRVVAAALGVDRVTGVRLAAYPGGEQAGELDCDLVLVSGGWNPTAHLYSQARGTLGWNAAIGALVPVTRVRGMQVAGAATGVFDTAGCLRSGAAAASAALADLGVARRPARGARCAGAAPPGRCTAALVGPFRRRARHPLRRSGTRCHRQRRRARHRRRPALGRARQALHDHRHGARPGPHLGCARERHRRRGAGRRHRRRRCHHLPAAVHLGRLSRRSPDAIEATCSTRYE